MGFFLFSGLLISLLLIKRLFDKEKFAHWKITTGLNESEKKILIKYFKFYQTLPPKSKNIFEYRVAKFIKLKDFVPRQMESVTMEMKVLIAATAIQLTFGFPKIFLSYFRYIIIFPDQFFSNSNQRFHKGEVNPKAKAIVLSWKHFVEGFSSAEGINLGLHEMAHALQLENIIMNHEFDFLNPQAIKEWKVIATQEMQEIRNGNQSFFRAYGATNDHEFFAVSVENFFERPGEFLKQKPVVYKALANLLYQDPVRLYQSA